MVMVVAALGVLLLLLLALAPPLLLLELLLEALLLLLAVARESARAGAQEEEQREHEDDRSAHGSLPSSSGILVTLFGSLSELPLTVVSERICARGLQNRITALAFGAHVLLHYRAQPLTTPGNGHGQPRTPG